MLAAPRLVWHRRDMTSLWFLCRGGITDEARRAHASTTGPCAGAAPSGRTRSGGTARRDRGLRWGRTARGTSCGAIAERLGVSAESIRRWVGTRPARDGMAGGLVPGHVVAEAVRSLTVRSPTGYRVEGLSIAETAALLRRLA